jgi:outer membrane protein assembly factor BamA
VVVFRPARPQARVAQISFEGNQVIPSSALQHAISDVAVGSAYSENRMRQLLDNAIRPLYEARGRLRVSFPKVVAEPAKDVQGVAVTVTVDEGTTYDLGSVKITGAAGFERADLLKAAAFKAGDLANFDEVNAGVSRLKKLMRRNGYMRVETSVDRKIDDTKKTVDLIIHIDEGAQFLFGTLHIEGLDIHGEAVIKRLWAIKEGKPFDADYPDFFLNRVREDGIFDNLGKTRSAAKVDEQARTVDVTLYFNK